MAAQNPATFPASQKNKFLKIAGDWKVPYLSDTGTREECRRQAAKQIVKSRCCEFSSHMAGIFAQFQYAATEGLQTNLRSKITKGAMDGRRQAAGTAEEWNTHSRYHHMTYKGMVQRSGVWNHPQKGRLDWPEELAAPVYDPPNLRPLHIHMFRRSA